MSTPKKYLCEGCPGTIQPRPVPHLRDISGQIINEKLRVMRRSNDEVVQQAAETSCSQIQVELCNGPTEVRAIRYDNEGSYAVPGETDLVCGRGIAEITEIAEVIVGLSRTQ